MFCMAGLFIGVTMFFPNGLAGLYASKVKPLLAKRSAKSASTPSHGAGPASTKPITTSSKAQEPVAGKPAAEAV